MNASDMAEVAKNLFPGWQGTGRAVAEAAAALLDIQRDSGVELEWECDENLRANLDQIGFKAISLFGTAGGGLARPAESLAGTLLGCHVAQSIYQRENPPCWGSIA
jgi:hypothetical protein